MICFHCITVKIHHLIQNKQFMYILNMITNAVIAGQSCCIDQTFWPKQIST